MKKIYLISYVDNEDNTKGVICASSNDPKYMMQEVRDSIKEWLLSDEDITDEDALEIIGNLREMGYAAFDEYELSVEITYLY